MDFEPNNIYCPCKERVKSEITDSYVHVCELFSPIIKEK